MTENSSMFMPVAPAYGGYGNNDGLFGGNGAWFILILLALFGWGNGFGGGFGGYGANGVGSEVQRGFDQATLTNGITGLQTAVCNGFAGVNQGVANGFAQAEIAANSRQMADMNQQFALQSAMQNCCCENRSGIADLKYTVATEACSDRNAIASALRDVLEANNASTQRILDTMCQDKIDAKNERIAELRQQLQMAQLAASQGAQTAAIMANNEAQTAALEKYLAPVPIPAYVVQNPSCACGQYNYGYNCAAA
jgi:hypothetical protein